MPKKHEKTKKLSSVETESDSAVHGDASGELVPPDVQSQNDHASQEMQEHMPASTEEESSTEDLLDDVRRSLIEEDETDKSNRESRWWRRIGRKGKSTVTQPSTVPVEIDLPSDALLPEEVQDPLPATEPDQYGEQIDDLISLLEAEQQQSDPEAAPPMDTEVPPQPEINFDQLKEQAFRPGSAEDVESDVRSIALDGGEEVFVEVEVQAADPLEERLKGLENALKPYRTYIYLTLAFLGAVMAVVAGLLIFNAYQQARPEPLKEVSNLPYPIAVSLPGGWSFNLGRGTLQAGQWEPGGAEWLEGTEVCRWVSLPWSRQLEAVLRTLNPNDPIELVMSNNDKLLYGVYSVYEMTPEEIHALDANSPCLLLILTGSDAEKRWVLTALP